MAIPVHMGDHGASSTRIKIKCGNVMKTEGVKTTCPRCGNIWIYKRRSNGMYTTCPACRYLFKNPEVKQ